MKHLKFIGVLSTLIVAAFAILTLGQSFAATNTPTTLGITAGNFTFYKDITGGNTSATIDLGTYPANMSAFDTYSSGNHRFVASDMLGSWFTVTIVSSALTATNGTIAATNVSYTGTARTGTGQALTAAPTSAADIGTAPVTFVSRTNNNGLSVYSQDITLKVAVPAAQAPGAYTGQLTFTY